MLSIKTGWEVHNDIQLTSKKKELKCNTQCYSNLTENKTKKCSDLGVSVCFSRLNMESLSLNTSLGGGAF